MINGINTNLFNGLFIKGPAIIQKKAEEVKDKAEKKALEHLVKSRPIGPARRRLPSRCKKIETPESNVPPAPPYPKAQPVSKPIQPIIIDEFETQDEAPFDFMLTQEIFTSLPSEVAKAEILIVKEREKNTIRGVVDPSEREAIEQLKEELWPS